MVYMDIDYMQDYKDFTVNEERFPDFEGFVQDMKKKRSISFRSSMPV